MAYLDTAALQHQCICVIRPLGLFTILPLGWDFIGLSLRVSLAVAAALFIAPLVPAMINPPQVINIFLEFSVGMVIALPASLLIECAGNAGELFDTLRGQNVAVAYDPLQQQNIALSGTLAKYAVWALLLANGTLIDLLRGLVQSYSAIPASAATISGLQTTCYQIFIFLPRLLCETIAACVPFALTALCVELVFAFVAKQLPGLPLSLENFLAKLFAGTLLITAVLQNGVAERLRRAAYPIQQLLLTIHS